MPSTPRAKKQKKSSSSSSTKKSSTKLSTPSRAPSSLSSPLPASPARPSTGAAAPTHPSSSAQLPNTFSATPIATFPVPAAGGPSSSSPSLPVPRSSSRLLVLVPGSSSLRIGGPEEIQPKVRAMCVANRIKDDRPGGLFSSSSPSLTPTEAAELARLQAIRQAEFENLERIAKKSRQQPPLKNSGRLNLDEHTVPIYDSTTLTATVSVSADQYASQFTDVSKKPAFITGNAAVKIHPKEPYEVYWPIRRGRFNLSGGRTISSVLTSLERILMDALTEDMKIQKKDFAGISCGLCVPDSWSERELVEFVNLLFNQFEFKEVILQKESLMSAFGAGVGTTCLVDIGAQKTHVVCIENGLAWPRSSIVLEYGGDDLSSCLAWALGRHDHYFPFPSLSLGFVCDWRQIRELKERFIFLSDREFPWQWFEIHNYHAQPAGNPVIVHKANLSCAALIAALALFHPALFEPLIEAMNTLPMDGSLAPVDIFTEQFLDNSPLYLFTQRALAKAPGQRMAEINQLMPLAREALVKARAQAQSAAALAAAQTASLAAGPPTAAPIPVAAAFVPSAPAFGGSSKKGSYRRNRSEIEADRLRAMEAQAAGLPVPPKTGQRVGQSVLLQAMGAHDADANNAPMQEDAHAPSDRWANYRLAHRALHTAIFESLGAVENTATQQRLSNCIVLSGGSCKIRGLTDVLEERLLDGQPPELPHLDSFTVIAAPKAVDLQVQSWKGMAIVCREEIAKDQWFSKEEWTKVGPKILRERVAFPI